MVLEMHPERWGDPALAGPLSDQAQALVEGVFGVGEPVPETPAAPPASGLSSQLLDELTPPQFHRVFFTQSGSEANETAFKLARIFGNNKRYEVISMENSFHGRTIATIALTGTPAYREVVITVPRQNGKGALIALAIATPALAQDSRRPPSGASSSGIVSGRRSSFRGGAACAM